MVSRLVKYGGWTGVGAHTSLSSAVMRKSIFSKRVCVPGGRLMPWLAIRGLGVDIETRKISYLVHQVLVFRTTDE
jgi:hypothetical protein